MTGQLVSRLGTYDNASDFAASVPTFAHYLRQAGYRTCLAGRMHFVGPDQLHGFEERVTTDVYPADFAWVPDWLHADERIDRWYHNMDSVFEAGSAVTAFQIEYDEEVAFAARRRLMQYACDDGAPFALVASFMNPHDPYVALPDFWNLYDEGEIDLPVTDMAAVPQDPFSVRVRDGIGASAVTPSAAVHLSICCRRCWISPARPTCRWARLWMAGQWRRWRVAGLRMKERRLVNIVPK
jgi:choline-sulfatase